GALSNRIDFVRVQTRYIGRWSDATELRATAAVGRDNSAMQFGANYVDIHQTPISGRLSLSRQVIERAALLAGVDLSYAPYDAVVLSPRPPSPGEPGPGRGTPPLRATPSGARFEPGAFVEATVTPWRGASIVPGIRVDYDGGTRAADVSPRLNVRQDLTPGFPRTTAKAGV